MSKFDKLLTRFLSVPADFRWDELESMLSSYGYKLRPTKKTGGSRRAFVNEGTGHVLNLHEPHPGSIVKRYALRQVIDSLKEVGVIKR